MGSSWEPEASCCCMCVLILSREDWVQGELFQAGASREIVFGPRLNLSLALSLLSLVRSFSLRGRLYEKSSLVMVDQGLAAARCRNDF